MKWGRINRSKLALSAHTCRNNDYATEIRKWRINVPSKIELQQKFRSSIVRIWIQFKSVRKTEKKTEPSGIVKFATEKRMDFAAEILKGKWILRAGTEKGGWEFLCEITIYSSAV